MGCVQGIIKTSEGEPAAGLELTMTGGESDETTTTDENGRWSFSVSEAGSYTVAVTEESLPDGQFLKSKDPRTVDVKLHTVSAALFGLSDEPGQASPTTETDDSDSDSEGAEATPGANPNVVEGQPAPEAGGDGFSWPRFWQQLASGIRMGLLLSLGAVGLSLVYGTTGLSNFSHAEMLSMGGIFAFLFMQITGNLWLTGLIVVALMAGVGWLQDAVLWKPLRKKRLSLMQMMIVSIGFSIVLQNIFQFFFGANILRIDPSTPKTVRILGVTLTVQSYIAMGIALVLIIAVGLIMKYTRFGRATRAVADNRPLAEASGIDVQRVIRLVWVMGVALAGLSGMLIGLVLNGIAWNTGWHFLLLLFAAVILGGIGTAFGAIVGAMIIGIIVETANIWLPGDLKHAAALFILIVVLLVRPQGLFGRKERIG
ncbi:branched-chain amino acid ABC transporter permease [Leucobacter sp. UCMA 4100]|uniref:branched-chain amino acid ABC transporter permease n=1 Tax=Leucobacter sp. UCMA 4100 TaxID=2810534 RepID=UPI0022EA6E75|nr:branched-chain amino acid ABC transporter permease [Leucobacter sp. UCMA 4100]